ncbi:hypothetical protein DD606_25180, partial [Enterobacter cloacae complex sp. GF14B]
MLRIPERVLLDSALRERVEALWTEGLDRQDSPADRVASGLAQISCFFLQESLARRAAAREAEQRLRRGIALLQRMQEQHPDSPWLEEQLQQARQELASTEERRHEFAFHRQASKWTQVGDRVTGAFFEAVGPRPSHAKVSQLRRPDGSIAS